MGVLDDLKQEASQRQRGNAPTTPAETARAAGARELEAALRRLHDYFHELRSHLEAAAPDISVDYRLHGELRLAGLKQGGYKFGTHQPDSVDRFTFHFTCESAARRELKVTGRELAVAQRDRLREHNLRFQTRDLADGGLAFVVESHVPVALDFARDDDKGVVRLTLRNLQDIGTLTYSLPPDRVDEELADELAKAVLRKPHRLAELTGHEVSEAARMKLRVQLAEDRLRREREMAEREQQAKPKGLLGGKLGRGLFGRGR